MRVIITLVLSFFIYGSYFSQIINSSFIAPDTVCVNQTFTIQNTSTGSISSSYWSFCASATSTISQAVNLGFDPMLDSPTFLSIQNDGGNYYMFVSNNNPGAISRLAFGNSLNNIPVSTNLGNFSNSTPINGEGIFIEKEGANWFGVCLGGPQGSDRICRISFGTSLANTPTVVNMGNIGAMFYSTRLQIVHSGGNKYGFSVNYFNNTITRFNFGNSLLNVPTGVNLGNIGNLNGPGDIAFVNYNGNWHAFIPNDNTSTITRLDFGNSLLNTPTGTNVGNPGGVSNPRGIAIDVDCNGIKGQLTNRSPNGMLNLAFPSGPTGPIVTTNLGNIANFSFPHSIEKYRIGDTVFTFIPNAWSNSISRLKYASCVNNSVPTSTLQNLAPITFTSAGVYQVSLFNNELLFNKSVFCKNIVVYNPTISIIGSPTIVCSGSTSTLIASGGGGYTWSPGPIIGQTVIVNPIANTIYTLNGANGSCISTKTIQINVNPSPTVTANSSSVLICIGSSVTLSSSGAISYTWNPGSTIGQTISATPPITTTYTVTGVNALGCTNTAAITVTVITTPTLVVSPPSPTVCFGSFATLVVTGASNYTWNPTASTASAIVVSPTATTVYTIVGTIGTCSNTTTVSLQVDPNPTVGITASSNSICSGSTANFTATGANSYSWIPSVNLSGSTGSFVTSTTSVSSCYTVIGTNTFGCISNATVCLTVQPTPTVNILNTPGSICIGDQASLEGSGATNYTWMPTSSNNTNIIVSPTTTTTYTLFGNSGGVCTGSMVSTVSVNPFPSLATLAMSPTICLGKSSVILASGASNYTWQPGGLSGSSVNVTPTVSTTYTIIGSELNCASTITVDIMVAPIPTIDIYMSPTVTCISSTQIVTLTAGGASTFTWLPISSTAQSVAVTPSVSLVYSVSGANSAGCVSQNSIALNISPDLQAGSSAAKVCFGNTVNLTASGALSYSWMPGNFTQANVNVIPDASTSYTVIGTNGLCSQVKAVYVEVTAEVINEIPEVFTPNDDGKNDKFVIKSETQAKIDIKVFNRWGTLVYSNAEYDNKWDGTANTGMLLGNNKLPQGTYYYVIDIESCSKQLIRGYVVIQY